MKIVHIREHGGRRERDRKEERGRREETVDAVFVRHEQSAKKRKTAAADEELFLQKRGRRWQTPTRTCGRYLSKVCRCNLNQ